MIPTPIEMARGLLSIHHHLVNEDKSTTVIYKEDELLELLAKWGFPIPDREGNARHAEGFVKMLQEIYLITPPGDTIMDCMKARDMKVSDLCEKLGIPEENVKDLLLGNLRVNGFAERLEEVFGIDKQFWINRQARYDKRIAEASLKEQDKKH